MEENSGQLTLQIEYYFMIAIAPDDLILKFQADFMKKFCRIDEKIRKGLQEFVQLSRKNECKKSL